MSLENAAFAALLLMPLAAAGERAERPAVRPGDHWQFAAYYDAPTTQPTRSWTVTAVTSTRIEGLENGEPLVLTPEMNVLDSPRTRYSSTPRALAFPMEVGKRWRYDSEWVIKSTGSRGRVVADVSVVAHEDIDVAAGRFAAFKLVSKGRIEGARGVDGRIDAEVTATYWYAPAARAIVKSISRNPYLGTSTVELVRFRLQP